MSIYSTPKSRKRIVIVGATAAILSTALVGGGLASLTVETVREGSSLTAELRGGIEFDEGSGVIVKNVSPGQTAEEFIVTGTNVGNVPGHVMLSVDAFDTSKLSEGFLDNTKVQVVFDGINYPGTQAITLRDFVTKGFGAPRVEPGANVKYSVVITPAATAEGFTAEDLGNFNDATFNLKFTFSGIGDDGASDLSEYIAVHGESIATVGGNIFALPNADIKTASETGVAVETVGD